jgi:hypothetical protein
MFLTLNIQFIIFLNINQTQFYNKEAMLEFSTDYVTGVPFSARARITRISRKYFRMSRVCFYLLLTANKSPATESWLTVAEDRKK